MTQTRQTILTLDTEFTDFTDSRLISLGLADINSEDTFYAELTDTYRTSDCSLFVIQIVLPLLQGGIYAGTRVQTGEQLHQWLLRFPQPITVLTDSPEYDWTLLIDCLGFALKGLSIKVTRFDSLLFGPALAADMATARELYYLNSNPEHHALHDALALKWMTIRAIDLGWSLT